MSCDRLSFEAAFADGMRQTERFLLSKRCAPDEAEELAQFAWAKAWEKRESFRGDSDLVTWVIAIALNLLRMKRRVKWVFVDEAALNVIGRRPRHDAKILVDQILAVVDPRTRQVLEDCYLTERTPRKGNAAHFRAVRKAREKAQSVPTFIAKMRRAAA